MLGKNELVHMKMFVYVIELSLKLSPFPLSVQRKELEDAESLYAQVCDSMEKGHQTLFQLTCEKVPSKKITVLIAELAAVQLYEKTASTGGIKRPGFSFEA